MATTHSTEAMNAATNAVTALLGTGAKVKLRTAGSIGSLGTAAATLAMSTDAFGDAANGIATANEITSDTDSAGHANDVATGTIEESDGTVHIHFEVAASGKDADLSNGVKIEPGDTVSCSSLTYKALVA